MYPDDPPQLVSSIVCYVDILGFSQLSSEALSSGNGNEFLGELHTALNQAYERVRKHSKGWSEQKFVLKIFTDNVVVGYPLLNSDISLGEYEFGNIFSVFAEFQVGLSMEGFLVRGGIAIGDHFMDDDIVFGDALLEAVKKDHAGGPPRISLAPSAVEILQHHLGFYGDGKFAPQYNDLLQDIDNEIFIDYLNQAFIAYPEGGIFFDVISSHEKTIINGLKKYKGIPDIKAKYEWAARYHNYVCTSFMEHNPIPTSPDADPENASAAVEAQKLANHIIDIESYAATPGKLKLKPIHPRQQA